MNQQDKQVRSKKISVLINTLNQGGAERAFVHIANGLFRAGCDVELVTALSGDGVYRKELAPGLPFADLNAGRQRHYPSTLSRYLSARKPDIILSALMNNWTVAIGRLSRYPGKIIISERQVLSVRIANEKNRLLANISYAFSKLLYPRADRIVAVSRGVADDLLTLGIAREDKIIVIHNPVVTDYFNRLSGEEPVLPLLHRARPNIVAMGRLEKDKDFALLLKAFAMLREETPCRLVIFGEGKLRSELERMIEKLGMKDDVLLPGFVINPFPYLARADCFVLSSIVEGLPNVLIQALACGTMSVSTNCPSGPDEILDGGKYGILTPVGDAEALCGGMKEALAHPLDPKVLKERAELYSEKNCIDAYLELFEELTKT